MRFGPASEMRTKRPVGRAVVTSIDAGGVRTLAVAPCVDGHVEVQITPSPVTGVTARVILPSNVLAAAPALNAPTPTAASGNGAGNGRAGGNGRAATGTASVPRPADDARTVSHRQDGTPRPATPGYEPPVFPTPAFDQPVFDQPGYESPVYEQPLGQSPAFPPPVVEPRVEPAPRAEPAPPRVAPVVEPMPSGESRSGVGRHLSTWIPS